MATKKKSKEAPPPEKKRGLDPRIIIYGVIDLILVSIYAYAIFGAAPNRHLWAQLLLFTIPLFAFLMGVGTVVGGMVREGMAAKIGWITAVVGAAGMLVFMVVVLGLLLASAAFLSGVYGAFGKAAAGGILGACALIVEVVGFVPMLQLKFLMTRGGRRAFGLPPLWAR
jgi:hypothetical protein